jgi:hypothetical protein
MTPLPAPSPDRSIGHGQRFAPCLLENAQYEPEPSLTMPGALTSRPGGSDGSLLAAWRTNNRVTVYLIERTRGTTGVRS